jgi:predicted murein hydrolase (TIGR00659 family)
MTLFSSIPPALLWSTASLAIYSIARYVYLRVRFPLFHPVMLTGAALIVILTLTGTEYETYLIGGRLISFFLGPSVVALGVPLYLRLQEMKRSAPMLLTVVLFGSAVGIVSAVVPALLMGSPDVVVRALAPKSVTTPIAIAVATGIGGDASLTAAFVVLTGIFGAVLGPVVLRLSGVKHPIAFGFAMGCAAHGIGTARSLEEGQLHGAAAGLGICLCGIMTAILTPFLVGMLVG